MEEATGPILNLNLDRFLRLRIHCAKIDREGIYLKFRVPDVRVQLLDQHFQTYVLFTAVTRSYLSCGLR